MKFILEITLQKINKNYKSQFLSYNIKNISILKLPLRVAGILFIFGQQMLNKTFADLEYITSSCSTDGSLTSGSISANGSNGSKQISPFFSAFGIPAALQPLEITCSPSDVVDFRNQQAISQKSVSRQQELNSLTSICSTYLPSSSCCRTRLVYHSLKFRGFQSQNFAETNFAIGQKTLEIRGMKFRGWQKILIFVGIKFRDLAKKS